MEILLYVLGGMVIGGIIAWVLRKAIAEKDMMPRSAYREKEQAALQAEANMQAMQSQLRDVQLRLQEQNEKMQTLSAEKEQVQIALASARTRIENSDAQQAELLSADKQNREELERLKNHLVKLNGENEVLKEKNATIKKEIEELGEKYTTQFKNLANEILEDKSKKFTEENSKSIKQILDPLNNDIKEFKKKVEETYEKENKQRFSLEERIKDLVQLNNKISEDANNLTKALKGERKTQGDWGEMILENILQESGLTEGREYVKQEFIRDAAGNTLKNEAGNRMQPDFVILYPDKRKVVIDSKVSLSAYERFSSSEDAEVQKKELENHINAIYAHIDELSKRNYQDFINSLDFVMLFIPIEPAYLLAMQKDRDIWSYAYRKRIILISPTNLIAAIKLISELWKKDEQNKNAIAIAERGGILYDKFVGFIENLENIGEHIGRSQKSYDDAMKQLKDGSGNLIGQAEKLRKLGVQAKKQLPDSIVQDADSDAEA
ncbi:MAG: DNA recombination protein RmuC [Chitinophagales bacterium]